MRLEWWLQWNASGQEDLLSSVSQQNINPAFSSPISDVLYAIYQTDMGGNMPKQLLSSKCVETELDLFSPPVEDLKKNKNYEKNDD